MTNLRAQAAAAAREWHDRHIETRMPRDNMDAAEFWLLGHSAGFSEGTRAFAEKLIGDWTNEENQPWYRGYIETKLAELVLELAAHAGTGNASEGKEEEE